MLAIFDIKASTDKSIMAAAIKKSEDLESAVEKFIQNHKYADGEFSKGIMAERAIKSFKQILGEK